jgi:hypothetical protein
MHSFKNEQVFWSKRNLIHNDGYLKNLMHQTKFQDFLIKKFSISTILNGNSFLTSLNLLVKSTYPFKDKLSKMSSKLAYLYKLEQIYRESK